MVSLGSALRARKDEGVAIPCPYPGLRDLGAIPRRATLTMVAAASGTGKTAFVLDWMLALGELQAPPGVLYMSMDSDVGTVGVRTVASTLGLRMPEAQNLVLELRDEKVFADASRRTRHIDFRFDPAPTPEQILAKIASYEDVHGCWPDIIVVDNLSDISRGDADEADIARWLKNQAGVTGAAVIVLHHVNAASNTGTDVVPMGGISNQVHRPQRLVLTLCRPFDGIIRVSVVKNSNGPAQKDGLMFVDIGVDLERMRFAHG
jgi:RecA-family ATPase